MFLEYKDCVDVLDAIPDDKADQAEKKADYRVSNYIVSTLSDLQFDIVCNETFAEGMIDILDCLFPKK